VHEALLCREFVAQRNAGGAADATLASALV